MVSVRSATMSIILIELVLSCTIFLSSLAVVSAQAQSVSIRGEQLSPTLPVLATCAISFCLSISSILAMIGMSQHKSTYLLPHMFFSVVVCIFHAIMTSLWLINWFEYSSIDSDWIISLLGTLLFQACLFTSIYLEFRCYSHKVKVCLSTTPQTVHCAIEKCHIAFGTVTLVLVIFVMPNAEALPFEGNTDYQIILVAEMVLLVAGETGLGLLHGWTEGVSYALQPYYTPMWACAVLMVLLFLLIFSLFLVFVFLHFNRPWVIKHHTLALWLSWPVAICLNIGAMASGAPFLVGFLIFLYFCSLLPFAYVYGSAEWRSTELPEV